MNPVSKSCELKSNQKVFYLQFNQVASCCRAHTDQLDTSKTIADYQQKWQQESQQLINGVELDGCQVCWVDERQGKISYRQQATDNTNVIQLYLSNLCNHMCSYCSSKYSSLWEESIKTHGVFQNISLTANNNLKETPLPADINHWLKQIQNYINTCNDNSVSLTLLGGEPLMQQRNLEKLLNLNSNKIKKLQFHTNLNPPNNKFLIWILDNISVDKLKITISLDSSPEYNHVPRAGFNQTNFLSNLKLLQNKNIKFNFNSVISVLSIFDLESFINWRDVNNFNITFTKIYNPDCLDPQYVPLEFRERIWKKINHLPLESIITEILQQPDNIVDLKLFEQYNYLSQYFERTGIIPTQINNELFVEYWTWLTRFINEKFNLE